MLQFDKAKYSSKNPNQKPTVKKPQVIFINPFPEKLCTKKKIIKKKKPTPMPYSILYMWTMHAITVSYDYLHYQYSIHVVLFTFSV